ncbi:hypothetical protein [Agrococcus sp. TF02-05]|uniref:hypothetical protein n=1 Tax=Agrococcus sp. TF02-05 TaxID=2815211 RepID=UPI001AA1CACA|nr:hypothetical protein [Agrococcus sp. TF02-05]MBO1770029.1 hypothetical protein [Agrococcus sp. TF02-05]
MAVSAPPLELSAPTVLPARSGAPAPRALLERLRRPRTLLALVLLVLIGAGIAVFTGATARSEPIAPLGAAADIPGGVARVNGVIPLERDGWLPADPPAVLTDPVPEGRHLVRVELQLAALDAEGTAFIADDYSILGLGAERVRVLWASPAAADVRRGEVLDTTLVFEIPDRAIALTLEGERGGRLALGAEHHTSDR